jgi:hemin uptake protein HemP
MNMSESKPGQNEVDSGDETSAPLRSEDILRGKREVKIAHEGVTYRLLVTRNGKLILQK